jgi:hypothetical protein
VYAHGHSLNGRRTSHAILYNPDPLPCVTVNNGRRSQSNDSELQLPSLPSSSFPTFTPRNAVCYSS